MPLAFLLRGAHHALHITIPNIQIVDFFIATKLTLPN